MMQTMTRFEREERRGWRWNWNRNVELENEMLASLVSGESLLAGYVRVYVLISLSKVNILSASRRHSAKQFSIDKYYTLQSTQR